MKKILFSILVLAFVSQSNAQEFASRLTEAKTAYKAGKLEDARFAMEQMLQELDIITGKEVLKLLPQKMADHSANTAQDNVAGSSGFFGVVIHRDYGNLDSTKINLEVISNSPMLASINALLSLPFMAGSGENKIIKIQGYKALVQKSGGEGQPAEFEVQVPLNSALVTLRAPGYSQEDVIKMANTIPVADIAKMLQ